MQQKIRIRFTSIVLFISLAFFTFTALAGADYYVSPSGSDSNSGTEAAPFVTIAKARDVVTFGAE